MKQSSLVRNQEKQAALDVLNCQIRSCKKCNLSFTRKHALIGEGNINAHILLVALSPGEKEDLTNQMFIGPSGRVLNKLFLDAGIERDMLYMTNLIKCMLPKNRKPKMSEIELCSQYMDKELSIIHPEVVVPLGYYATRTILQKYHTDLSEPHMENAKEAFGKLFFLGGCKIFPLPHPASLLYNPSYEPDTREKYKKLAAFL